MMSNLNLWWNFFKNWFSFWVLKRNLSKVWCQSSSSLKLMKMTSSKAFKKKNLCIEIFPIKWFDSNLFQSSQRQFFHHVFSSQSLTLSIWTYTKPRIFHCHFQHFIKFARHYLHAIPYETSKTEAPRWLSSEIYWRDNKLIQQNALDSMN